MAFLSSLERAFLRAASRLAFCNPFLPERVEHERAALGTEFADDEPVWSFSVHEPGRRRANVWRIGSRLDELCPRLRGKLAARVAATEEDRILYEDGVLNLLVAVRPEEGAIPQAGRARIQSAGQRSVAIARDPVAISAVEAVTPGAVGEVSGEGR